MSESFDDFERRVRLIRGRSEVIGRDIPDDVARLIVRRLDEAYRRLLERLKDDASLLAVADHIVLEAGHRNLPINLETVDLLFQAPF
ncbi:hypothetical protein [Mycobacteroides abscessus]|uniref:hypothetical protein n=1 Tax=Mycobacteroides abscessus TaxID=36809 RepID=UPI0013001698|nr:hypothetical protein [Mycobacteroides abscessus]